MALRDLERHQLNPDGTPADLWDNGALLLAARDIASPSEIREREECEEREADAYWEEHCEEQSETTPRLLT